MREAIGDIPSLDITCSRNLTFYRKKIVFSGAALRFAFRSNECYSLTIVNISRLSLAGNKVSSMYIMACLRFIRGRNA